MADAISLPVFLKALNASGIPMAEAMGLAKKIYPTNKTLSALSSLSDVKLYQDYRLNDKLERKKILKAIKTLSLSPAQAAAQGWNSKQAGSSSSPSAGMSGKGKRKHDDPFEMNDVTPAKIAKDKKYEFGEILDIKTLKSKSVITNRAPVMAAWACVVSERLGFSRPEALSIAQAYTSSNADAKAVSMGIKSAKDTKDTSTEGGNQPFVEIMGRKISVMSMEDGTWSAIQQGERVDPSQAYSYITRSFAQQTSFVIGALKLLASTFTKEAINEKGYALYCEFRPKAEGWGKKSELKMADILALLNPEDEVEDEKREEDADMVVSSQGEDNRGGLQIDEFGFEIEDGEEETGFDTSRKRRKHHEED